MPLAAIRSVAIRRVWVGVEVDDRRGGPELRVKGAGRGRHDIRADDAAPFDSEAAADISPFPGVDRDAAHRRVRINGLDGAGFLSERVTAHADDRRLLDSGTACDRDGVGPAADVGVGLVEAVVRQNPGCGRPAGLKRHPRQSRDRYLQVAFLDARLGEVHRLRALRLLDRPFCLRLSIGDHQRDHDQEDEQADHGERENLAARGDETRESPHEFMILTSWTVSSSTFTRPSPMDLPIVIATLMMLTSSVRG